MAEAALLASLPKAPSRFCPFKNPEKALKRRSTVRRTAPGIQASLIAIDPQTGHIKAMAEGRDFWESMRGY